MKIWYAVKCVEEINDLVTLLNLYAHSILSGVVNTINSLPIYNNTKLGKSSFISIPLLLYFSLV